MPYPTRVLITGASGLLGMAVLERLRLRTGVLPLCHNNPVHGMVATDLMAPGAVAFLDRLEWDAVVHCAAFRSPDYCEVARDLAWRLNAEVPGWIAELAARRTARMIHISTDYVFPGTHPPYREGDAPLPVNWYGQTKLEAEHRVLATHPRATVLRIPALYGRPLPPATSALLQEGLDAARASVPVELDDAIVRYPTYVNDVAHLVALVLDSTADGVIHVSAPTRATRYEWARVVAGMIGRRAEHLKPVTHGATRAARRPMDCHLATERLHALGLPEPRGYLTVLPLLLRD